MDESKVMPVDVCARQIIAAAAARNRELVMTFRGKLGCMLKPFLPWVIDNAARNAICSAVKP